MGLPDLSSAEIDSMLSRMWLIRRFDERVIKLFEEKAFPGHYHVYFGQEATGTAAVTVAQTDDYIFTTHRNHGHLLARGVDPKRLMAEILGRSTGTNGGISGTFHCSDPGSNFLHTSAVVGGIIPIAVGVAYATRRQKRAQATLAIFGEGSLQEGAFHEAMIITALHRPPVVFLVENNDIESVAGQRVGPYTYLKTAPVNDLCDYARIHDVHAERVDGNDLGAVYQVVGAALDRARKGEGPSFIEARMYRWPGQFGSWPKLVQGPARAVYAWDEAQVPADYRQWWLERDPVIRVTREALAAGQISRDRALEIEARATRDVDEAERFAKDSPFPPLDAALQNVFADASRGRNAVHA